jgi:hypothetical protein
MCMMRSQTHAGSVRGLGRLVLTNEHHCSRKNPTWTPPISRAQARASTCLPGIMVAVLTNVIRSNPPVQG